MLKIYRDKDGYTFQYEEGTQPEGYVLDEPEKKETKKRQVANKAKAPKNKAAK